MSIECPWVDFGVVKINKCFKNVLREFQDPKMEVGLTGVTFCSLFAVLTPLFLIKFKCLKNVVLLEFQKECKKRDR